MEQIFSNLLRNQDHDKRMLDLGFMKGYFEGVNWGKEFGNSCACRHCGDAVKCLHNISETHGLFMCGNCAN